MKRRFVEAKGLHSVFRVNGTKLDLTTFKSEVSDRIDSDAIIFITVDTADEIYGYSAKDKYIWARGELYDCTRGITKEELEEFIKDKLDRIISLTWRELRELRNAGRLIPGQDYLISDYETMVRSSVSLGDISSANHKFGIIVTADSSTTLNERARAVITGRDNYFNNSHLNAWDIRYCLDNDSDRFDWVDGSERPQVITHEYDIHFDGLINPTSNQAILDLNNRVSISGANYTWTINSVTCHLNEFTTNLVADVRKFILNDGTIWTSTKHLNAPIVPSNSTSYMTITVPRAGTLNIAVLARVTTGWETITVKNSSGDIILDSFDIIANLDKNPVILPDGSTGYHTAAVDLPVAGTYTIDWAGSGTSKIPSFYGLIFNMLDPGLPIIDHPEMFGSDGFMLYCIDTKDKHSQDYSESGWLFGTSSNYKKFHYRHLTKDISSGTNNMRLTLPNSTGTLKICARTGDSSTTRKIVLIQNGSQIFSQQLSDSSATPSAEGDIFPVYEVDIKSGSDITINYPDGSIAIFDLHFEWSETVTLPGGRGVIYYMKDEFGNEAPYDFKNILFKRFKGEELPYGLYTFSSSNTSECTDTSMRIANKIYDNTIRPFKIDGKQTLNFIIFVGPNNYENSFGYGCRHLVIENCQSDIFGNGIHEKVFTNYACNDYGDNSSNTSFDDISEIN